MFFFEFRKIELFPGSAFSDHFWRRFFDFFYIDLVGAKIVLRKGACNSELNFAPKAQFFLPRLESAVLDAVLEDKPAQPLPCGSYLV